MKDRGEHEIQNDIRNALCDVGIYFRANVGTGWTGTRDHATEARLGPGVVVLRNARPFSTGLPAGFHDIFGMTPEIVTQDMVGTKIAIFTTIDAKSRKGRPSENQLRFADAVRLAGGRSGFAKSAEEAVEIAKGGRQ